MKSVFLIFTFLFSSLSTAQNFFSDEEKALIVLEEWNRLHSLVSELEPEFDVGGLLNGKSYQNHKLLWTLTDEFDGHEIIRIHIEKEDGNPFQISYHRGSHIVPGVNVVRRFIGPFYGGFSAHTIEKETGEYLGMQGSIYFKKEKIDLQVMEKWNITLF